MKSGVFVLLLMLALPALAEDAEIEFLLTSVEQSGCTFIRNGDAHPPADAADHLRMKYDRAGSRVKGAEQFIDRIASKSSLSGRPYTIQCGDGEPYPTKRWLTERLAEYQAAQHLVSDATSQ
ncbi:MAG: DUF5329 domain-containing protein [Chromatiales bacterium]|nr:MAG: DUF5329 domain-containing protein [Chromatiales bacterium]